MKHILKSVRTLAATLVTFGSLVGGANAAINIHVVEDGSFVTISSTGGSIDTTGLSMGSVSSFGPDLFHGNFSADGVTESSGSVAQFTSGSSTITRSNSPGWTSGSGSSDVSFSEGLATILLSEFSATNIMLSDGAVVGNNNIAAFSATTTEPRTLADIGYTVNESVTYSWAADSITLTTSPIPEPSSALLIGLGALGLVTRRRRIK